MSRFSSTGGLLLWGRCQPGSRSHLTKRGGSKSSLVSNIHHQGLRTFSISFVVRSIWDKTCFSKLTSYQTPAPACLKNNYTASQQLSVNYSTDKDFLGSSRPMTHIINLQGVAIATISLLNTHTHTHILVDQLSVCGRCELMWAVRRASTNGRIPCCYSVIRVTINRWK